MEQRLLVVSPVRNEAAHIERVALALAAQTRRPDAWIVVDDQSTDETPRILARLEQRLEFMTVIGGTAPDTSPATEAHPATDVHPATDAPASDTNVATHTANGSQTPPTTTAPANDAAPANRAALADSASPKGHLATGAPKDRLATGAAPRAFNRGLNSVDWRSYTHIAKIDGDTELPPRYWELLLNEFARDPTLGLAGGVQREHDGRDWSKRQPGANEYHVRGALKCYTRECLEAIGGIQERLGWDALDEYYARMRGFQTRAIPGLVALHHRQTGSADGVLRGRARHGYCAYLLHMTLPWVTMRSFKVARERPRVISGLAFMYGYVRAAASRAERVDDPQLRAFVRHELHHRERAAIAGLLACLPQTLHLKPGPKSRLGTAFPGPESGQTDPGGPLVHGRNLVSVHGLRERSSRERSPVSLADRES